MIQQKGREFSLPGLERQTEEPSGELALGEYCIRIISDKSNSLGMFFGNTYRKDSCISRTRV